MEILRRGPNSSIATRLANAPPDSVALCSVVVAELRYGAYRSQQQAQVQQQVETFCKPFVSVPFDDLAGVHFARVRNQLERRGA